MGTKMMTDPDTPRTTPAEPRRVRAAAVQMDIRLGEVQANLLRVLELLEEAAGGGAQLVVFPECALSGYCFESLEEARAAAISAGHSEHLRRFAARCAELGVVGVLGFIEAGAGCFNSAIVAGEAPGSLFLYRKTHLPVLGFDRFATPGNALGVAETSWGRLGVLICYDVRFPEAARVLALKGADVIALPTNWPVGAESSPDFLTRARAWENRVFLVAANRVGVERGRRFIGRSQIVAPGGEVLCEAGPDEEAILHADLDLGQARRKRIVYEPGAWELDVIGGRRPDLYAPLLGQGRLE